MSISLESAIRTLKVDSGSAPRLESERYIGNGEHKTCFHWSGIDMVGRRVSPDSFYTKSAGCHDATDRILVENQISRPRYFSYIALNPEGLIGDSYDYAVPPKMIDAYEPLIGFGTGVNSAITSKVPESRLLRAHEIYADSGKF